jgi:sugar/nucleoside kinase (ribokinase family)
MITVIGEALSDLVPASESSTLRVLPGGSPLNVAVGVARLGHPTALMARIPAATTILHLGSLVSCVAPGAPERKDARA